MFSLFVCLVIVWFLVCKCNNLVFSVVCCLRFLMWINFILLWKFFSLFWIGFNSCLMFFWFRVLKCWDFFLRIWLVRFLNFFLSCFLFFLIWLSCFLKCSFFCFIVLCKVFNLIFCWLRVVLVLVSLVLILC